MLILLNIDFTKLYSTPCLRSTSTLRQPLPATSPNPENMLVVQDHNSVLQFPETAAVFEYDPGFYTEFVHSNIQEGMESVSMSHLVSLI